MSADLDRFDRMLLGVAPASPTRATFRTPHGSPRYTAPEHEPTVVTSRRPPRFVDYTACPMCGIDRVGIEYHGTLLTGAKVHQLAAHTANMRRVDTKQPRCLGASMRLVFEGGVWKGAPAP